MSEFVHCSLLVARSARGNLEDARGRKKEFKKWKRRKVRLNLRVIFGPRFAELIITKQEGLLVGMSDKGIKSRGVVSHSGGQCPQP